MKNTFSFMSEIAISRYGLSEQDVVDFKGIINSTEEKGSIQEAVEFLTKVYTEHIAAEFFYLEVIIKIFYNRIRFRKTV